MSIYEQANKVDTGNFLGIENSTFKNQLYKLALSQPSKYFDLRQTVLDTVKKQALEKLYQTIYDLMLNGKDQNGNPLFRLDAGDLKPSIPIHTINNFALSATQTMENILDDLVEDYLMPISFDSILKRKFTQSGLLENPQA